MRKTLGLTATVVAAASLAAALGGATGCGGGAKPGPGLTAGNLKAAHQNSVDAQARYTAYAAKAAEEGYKSAAALFRAAARSEEIHVAKYAAALKDAGADAKAEPAKPEVKTTQENLAAALKAKTEAKEAVLPGYIKQAEADGQQKAARFFKGAMASDGEYVKLLGQAQGDLENWKAGDKEFLVCTVCSYVMTDPNIKQCPICSAPKEKFESFK
jgi:rubrerythrin